MLTIFKNILLKMLRVICILNFKFDKRFLFEKENLMDYSVDIHYTLYIQSVLKSRSIFWKNYMILNETVFEL